MNDVISLIFNALLHVLFVGAMVAFAVVLVRTALATDDTRERFFRFLALFLGAMIILGGQATGVSFPVFAAGALANAQVVSAGAAIVSGVIPALAGVGLGFYMIYVFRKNDERSYRVLCLVGMLALASFLTVYAVAASANGLFLSVAAIPNLSFTAGVGLVVLFGAGPKNDKDPSIVTRLINFALEKAGRRPAPRASEGEGEANATGAARETAGSS